MKLTEQELNTILAGLRLVQNQEPGYFADSDYFEDGKEPLDDDAIDDLCMRLNCECELAEVA